MKIRYADSDESWNEVIPFIEKLVLENSTKSILEVGAGANPTFPLEFVKKHNLSYTLLDISQEELDKAPEGYNTIQADIAAKNLEDFGSYDFIFTRMLAEHVKSGENFHRNTYQLLADGGTAFHFFPTLFALPFVVNRILPERFARWVLSLIQSGREQEGHHAKFPAYYSWCRGPSNKQIKKFEKIGFTVSQYIGFFGHAGYYRKLPFIEKIHRAISNWLISHPAPLLTSFAYLVLKKES